MGITYGILCAESESIHIGDNAMTQKTEIEPAILTLLLLQAICLATLAVIPSRYKASEWHADIEVPEGMTLTLKEDYEFYVPFVLVDEWSFYEPEKKDYSIPGGTVSTPVSISYGQAEFVYEEDPDIYYSADFDKFEEADQLYALLKTAETKNHIVWTLYTMQGVTLGVLIGTIWFIGVGLLSQLLMKKKMQVFATVMNAIATFAFCIILFEYFPWLLI